MSPIILLLLLLLLLILLLLHAIGNPLSLSLFPYWSTGHMDDLVMRGEQLDGDHEHSKVDIGIRLWETEVEEDIILLSRVKKPIRLTPGEVHNDTGVTLILGTRGEGGEDESEQQQQQQQGRGRVAAYSNWK